MHRVIHFELGAQNPERAVKFYQDVFGWKIAKWEGPTPYWLVTTGEDSQPGINGGIMRHQDGGARTVNTISVASVDDALAKAVAHGAKVAMPKFPIPGLGWQAYCIDTEGNLFGIHQTDPNAK